jgi:molybdate transport system regulatory protein
MKRKKTTAQWHVDLWRSIDGQRIADSSRIALLLAVARTGSITAAARSLQISYKTAWDTLAAMEALAGSALITRSAGGRSGGGSQLTEQGQSLLQEYEQLITAQLGLLHRQQACEHNRLPLQVLGCKAGEVYLQTAQGQRLVALLGAEVPPQAGQRLEASVAPHEIIILKGEAIGLISARNRLPGVVQKILPGSLLMQVEQNLSLRVAITAESCEELALQPGSQVTALFKASSLLLDFNAAGAVDSA